MANSTRLPGSFNCSVGPGEMAAWKRDVRRRLRRRNRHLIQQEEYDVLLLPNDIATLWDAPGDGRVFINGTRLEEIREENPTYYRELTSK